MIIPSSVTDSIAAAGIDVSDDWLSSTAPVWNSDYSAVLTQPISIAVTPLADMRFLGVTSSTITIRISSAPLSLVSWSGIATLAEDGTTGGGVPTFPVHNNLTGRDVPDTHPMASITGLVEALSEIGGTVVEVANYAALPAVGSSGILYVTLDNNKSYRWGGTTYVEISASLALGETSTTAYRGDHGKAAYDHSLITSGNPHVVTADEVGAQVRHGFETIQATGAMPFTASYNNGTRVLTLTPTGASFSWWWYGVEHVQTGSLSLPAHSATTGVYYASFDSAGTVAISTTPWEILNAVPIAIFDQNSVRGQAWVYPEWHTTEMDPLTHKYHHFTSGTRFVDGGAALSGYTYNVDSLSAVTFGVASAEIWDEDLRFQLPALADGGPYQIRYRTAPGAWIWDSGATTPYKVGATYITADVAGIQTQANGAGAGQYINSYVLLIPGLNGPQTVILQGQGIFATQADAQAESWSTLSKDGLPFQEFYAVWRVTYWARSSHTGVTGRVRMVSITPVSASASGSVGGSSVHNALSGRSDADCHPTAAITGLDAALAVKLPLSNVSGTAGQVAVFSGTNTVGGDAGFTQTRTSGKTTSITVGDGTSAVGMDVYVNGAANKYKSLTFQTVGQRNWELYSAATSHELIIAAYDLNTFIDQPFRITNASGGAITLGGGGRPVNLTSGSRLQINGTDAITSARAGDLTALKVGSTTGFVRSSGGTYSASALVAGDIPALSYQPLENQRVSTGDSPTFSSLTVTSTLVGGFTISGGDVDSQSQFIFRKGFGYWGTYGNGVALTQSTSKSTGVTNSDTSIWNGSITMNAASLAQGAVVSFTLGLYNITNGNTQILINHQSGGTLGAYHVQAHPATGGGSATVTVRNIGTGGALAEAIVLRFMLITGSVA